MLSGQINFNVGGLRMTRTAPVERVLSAAAELHASGQPVGSVAVYDYRSQETVLVAIWYGGEGGGYYGR